MKLDELHKNRPDIPKGYFDKMTHEILQKTNNVPTTSKVRFINFPLYIAAGFAFLIGISIVNFLFDSSSNKILSEQKLMGTNHQNYEEEYYEFIDLYINDFDFEDLVDLQSPIITTSEDTEEQLILENDIEQIIELL